MADKITELVTRYPTEENVQELICALKSSPGVLSSPEARKANLRPTVWKYLLTSQPCLNPVPEPTTSSSSAAVVTPERPPVMMTQGDLDLLQKDCFVSEKFINESVCGENGAEMGGTSELCERLKRVVLMLRKVPNSVVSRRIASFEYSSWVTGLVTPFICNKMNEADAVQCSLVVIGDYAPFALSTDPEFLDDAMSELLKHLVYYYEPKLAFFIEQNGVSFNSFAPIWFKSLFTKVSTYECLLRLWDHYFIQRDPIFYIMIALGAILESRDEIMQKPSKADVSKFFTHFKFLTEEQVESVVARAIALSDHAPLSLRKQLQGVVARYETSKAWIQANILGAPCLHVSILDVLRDKKEGRIIFFVDCRSEEELAQGMLPTAYPLPINDLLSSTPAVFKDAIQRVKALQDETPEIHFCLYGRGGHSPKKAGNAELTAVVYKLLREDFRHVSLIQNGYLGIHNFALDGRVELTGHVKDSCPICLKHMSPLAKGFASVRGTLSKISHSRNIEVIRSRASSAMALIKQSIQTEEEKRRRKRTANGGRAPLAKAPDTQGAKEDEKTVEVSPSHSPLPEPAQKEGLFTIDDEEEEDENEKEVKKKSPKKKVNEEKVAVVEEGKKGEDNEEKVIKKESEPEVAKGCETDAKPDQEPAKEQEDDTVDFGDDLEEEDEKEEKKEEGKKEQKMTQEGKENDITSNIDDGDDDEEDEDDDDETKVEVPEGYSTIQSWMTQYSLWEVTPENGANKWFVTVNDKELTLLERHPKIFSYVRVVKSVPVKDIENAVEDKAANGAVVSLAGGAQERLVMDDAQEFVKAVKIALENKGI